MKGTTETTVMVGEAFNSRIEAPGILKLFGVCGATAS
jgi:hypothetical protein